MHLGQERIEPVCGVQRHDLGAILFVQQRRVLGEPEVEQFLPVLARVTGKGLDEGQVIGRVSQDDVRQPGTGLNLLRQTSG